jgi:hypothetical protein
MANNGMTCDPKAGTEREFRAIYNSESSTALVHGDIVDFDIAAAEIAFAAEVTAKTPYAGCVPVKKNASSNSKQVYGVIWDPSGATVKAGDRGTVMVKGFHPAVKVDSTVTAATHHLESYGGTTAGTAYGVAFASEAVGAKIGYPLEDGSGSADTVACFLCINNH